MAANFPGLNGKNIVLSAPDGIREILAKWLQRHRQISANDLEPTSWKFARLKTHGPVVFKSASDKQALAHEASLDDIRQLKDHGDGTAIYAIDLSH